MMRKLSAILCLGALMHMQAAQIFVDPVSGSDASGTGSIGSPYQTPEKATLLANPGDIVELRAGTYTSVLDDMNSGSAGGGYITIRSYNNEAVQFRTTTTTASFLPDGASYIIFSGINIDYGAAPQSGQGGIKIDNGSHHIVVTNCVIHDMQSSHAVLFASPSYTCWIVNNTMYNCATNWDGGTADHLVYLGGGALLTNVTVAWNHLYNFTNTTGSHNQHAIHNYSGPSNDDHKFTNNLIENGIYGIGIYEGSRILVANNIVKKCYNGILFTGPQNDNLIYYNTTYLNVANIGVQSGVGTGTKVYGNIAYGGQFGIILSPASNPVDSKYNVIYGSTITQFSLGGGSTDTGTLTSTDPLFTSAPTDFTLQASSPALDMVNVSITEVTTDYINTSRPQGALADAGAYERSVLAPPSSDAGGPIFRQKAYGSSLVR